MTISFLPVPFSPFRINWNAVISEFAWDDHFCDTQESGPFAYWHHCHRVESKTASDTGMSGTALHDVVQYELPMGPLGEIANELFVERQMKSIFAFRQKRTIELLGALKTS